VWLLGNNIGRQNSPHGDYSLLLTNDREGKTPTANGRVQITEFLGSPASRPAELWSPPEGNAEAAAAGSQNPRPKRCVRFMTSRNTKVDILRYRSEQYSANVILF
jgi:hypothetical protein